MATTDYWAPAPLCRDQATLFAPTLEAVIAKDDPVRMVDEVLSAIDWTEWEAGYDGTRGQPAIHPRHLAACWLYGLCRGIRSSRKLEEACTYRFDFIWLLSGRRPDHTTLAKFRTRFAKPLKGLFRQVCQIAMSIGLIRLGEVAFDGTRVKANNGRYKTRTARTLEEKLQVVDAFYEQMLREVEAAEQRECLDGSPTQLPPELANLDRRRQILRQALAQAQAADAAKKRKGVNPEKNPAQAPITDPDSRVMPNKEGGYAPNYTPTAITDGHAGFIVDADVLQEVNESSALLSGLERIEETCGARPERLLSDGGNNSGQLLEALEQRGIEAFVPVESSQPAANNPAHRPDPTQPVAETEWAKLPRSGRGQLDKSCFVYNAEEDQYYCPLGHAMPFEKTKPDERNGEAVTLRIYRCSNCAGCPLAAACLNATAQHGRTITRDKYEEVRQRTAARMATDEARRVYNQRGPIAETPFGLLKHMMGLRQFLLRGLSKVKTEWDWAITAFDFGKLVRALTALRAKVSAWVGETGI
jgi:transposase